MARSFFPDLPGGSNERAWTTQAPMAVATVPRVLWLGTVLIAGSACTLAAVFAGLWWRGEIHGESVETAFNRMCAESARLSTEQSRKRRIHVSTGIDQTSRISALTDEAARLRGELELSLSQAAATDKARQAAVAQLEQFSAAGQQQVSALEQERYRSAVLEQNLSLTQNDLNQRVAGQDEHVDSLQKHLISLRDTVTVREIEVRNITSAATAEIDRTRIAAQEIATEAEWLAAQLRTITCGRDRLHHEVVRLEQALQSERAANQSLACRIQHLQCRIRELEARPNPSPGGGMGPRPDPKHGHGHSPA